MYNEMALLSASVYIALCISIPGSRLVTRILYKSRISKYNSGGILIFDQWNVIHKIFRMFILRVMYSTYITLLHAVSGIL